MSVETEVERHYAVGAMDQRLTDALRAAGKDPGRPEVDDLAPYDEFHSGGREATVALAGLLDLKPRARLLDLGAGIGGPARMFARLLDCDVTGIDVTAEFVELARLLTERVGLADRVRFEQASALALPFPAASFDAATLLHVGMNIADKPLLFAEARRVLAPGGVFAVYDPMRTGDGPLTFPLPWAATEAISFVEPVDVYRQWLREAGFELAAEHPFRELALTVFRAQAAAASAGGPPSGLAALMGPEMLPRLRNLRGLIDVGVLTPTVLLARVPAA
jgi:ubiquinone/menaquinone biosynthesis C-methylase UbiE